MESGNLASGAIKQLTHMRERQPRAHAYAWHTSPRLCSEFKVPRICVDISQLLTHMRESRGKSQRRSRLSTTLMRGLLFSLSKHPSHPTHMRQQSRLGVVKHARITFMRS
ncbi:hypothetical protein PIB30_016249 [Stylosanthes scabra]|uniref:Uncharacterized protein n=1 Tax=Stylosanthes scabra TaxID=79078 RepID=A0ABU6Y5Z3_9FABA|nr:hypothetical protein [Stylosanthes scabra]